VIRTAALAGALASLALAMAGADARAQAVGESVDLSRLRSLVGAPSARDAIARVTWAEAAGQGDSGLAGVVYTILNRLAAGRWGASVDQVVNARAQFEPVMRAGGDWRSLPLVRPADRARIDTILNLALEGRLPDLTGGALYFQNPKIVAARAASGVVSPRLVHFGGASPSAVIGDHAFYVGQKRAPRPPLDMFALAGGEIIVGPTRPGVEARGTAMPAPSGGVPINGERGLVVLADGQIVEDPARAAASQP
jgi:hypothetical protein